MKMFNVIKVIASSLLACVLFSQAALAQQEVSGDRNAVEGLLDPNPEEFYCQTITLLPGCRESQACETAVCGLDSFCCSQRPGEGWDGVCVSEAQSFAQCLREPSSEPIARFKVDKTFDDGNPAEVEVTITCNTGLPLEQSDTISSGDGVTFVVRDFADGEMDCQIAETTPEGYTASYWSPLLPPGFPPVIVHGPDGCQFNGVGYGLSYDCDILNELKAVDVTVTKWWMDENPQFNAQNTAQANYSCAGEVFGQVSGSLFFNEDGQSRSFSVYPDWDGSTTCTVTESVTDSGVESDDSECFQLSVTVGNGASCNIYNTRLYEGIPTLSQYGLMIMALLMMGVGFVAFRRYS